MKKALFDELIQSIEQAGKIKKGEAKPSRIFHSDLDVKSIREDLGFTQNEFSIMIGVSARTLQNWEQGRRHPQGPALSLLKIIKNDPTHAVKALHKD